MILRADVVGLLEPQLVRSMSRLGRGALLPAGASAEDGDFQLAAEFFGELVQLGIAVDLDCLLGGVADYVAVVAPGEMVFQFRACGRVNGFVQVIG
jgi:hypothetical protein